MCTYSAAKNIKNLVKNADFVILDECHNSWSSTRKYLNYLQNKCLKLTATVHKNDAENVIFCYSYARASLSSLLQDYRVKVPAWSGVKKDWRFFELIKIVIETCQKHNKKRLIVFNRTIRDDIISAQKFSSSNEFTNFQE